MNFYRGVLRGSIQVKAGSSRPPFSGACIAWLVRDADVRKGLSRISGPGVDSTKSGGMARGGGGDEGPTIVTITSITTITILTNNN